MPVLVHGSLGKGGGITVKNFSLTNVNRCRLDKVLWSVALFD